MSASNGTSLATSPGPERWVPDGGRPLVLRLAERRPFLLVVGIALIAAAALVLRQVFLHPEAVQVPAAVAAVLVTLVVAFLGGLGVATVHAFVRAPSQTVTIDSDGLLLGRDALRLWWDELDAVAVRILAIRTPSARHLPRGPSSNIVVALVWCPRPDSMTDVGPSPARFPLPKPFTHQRIVATVQFTADPDVPVARDLDSALRHFAGRAYRPRILG